MSAELVGMGQWREYFRTANCDIFEIIEKGIMVAASDCPKEYQLRRDRIAEVLFTTRLTRCTHCDKIELSVPEFAESGRTVRSEFDGAGASKESKANSSRDDQTDLKLNQVSNCSFGEAEAEALTDEIEEEGLVLDEVLRIKDVLKNFENETDSVLFESLRRLQLMQLTVDILKATEIGKTVNGIRRHGAKQIRHLARELIDEWKAIVDEWVQATQETKGPADSEEGTPDSVHPSIDYEEGLPSPPMDDCAFFTTQSIDFAQFFDGMDDDGNPRNGGGECNNTRERGRRPPDVKRDVPRPKEQEPIPKPSNRLLNTASGPGRPVKPNGEQRINPVLQQRSDKPNIPRRPVLQPEKIRCSDEDPVQVKLEATKRKLQERYQEAEKAKKQRTIQVMELQDLPKQSLAQRNFHKFGNSNRNWANGRR